MVADAYDAVSACRRRAADRGRARRPLRLRRDQRRRGRAVRLRRSPSTGSRPAELDELRADFLRKAVLAGTDRVCRPLLAAGRTPDELAGLTLGDVPPSPDRDRLRARRAELGLPAGDDAPLLVDPVTGDAGGRAGAAAAPAPGPADPGQHRGQRRQSAAACCASGTRPSDKASEEDPMKAVRLHGYHQQPVIDEVPEPTVKGPLDVVVKIGGAGVCRTDLHIIEGQWAEAMAPAAALHDRARERRLGARGRLGGDQRGRRRHRDPAPDPDAAGCAGPAGPARTCTASTARSPAWTRDGGMAEYLLTSARACVKLDPSTRAAGRRGAGRRRHHRLPRGPQGDPAALSRAPPAC